MRRRILAHVLRLAPLLLMLAPTARGQEEDGSDANPGLMTASGFVLFYDDRAPLSFVTMTPGDLPKNAVILGEVRGKSCQHGLSVPLSASIRSTSVSASAGNGGYRRALDHLRKAHPELKGVFDVKIDTHRISILGIYRRTCVEILARGFK